MHCSDLEETFFALITILSHTEEAKAKCVTSCWLNESVLISYSSSLLWNLNLWWVQAIHFLGMIYYVFDASHIQYLVEIVGVTTYILSYFFVGRLFLRSTMLNHWESKTQKHKCTRLHGSWFGMELDLLDLVWIFEVIDLLPEKSKKCRYLGNTPYVLIFVVRSPNKLQIILQFYTSNSMMMWFSYENLNKSFLLNYRKIAIHI